MVALPVDAVVDGAAVPTERLEAEACTLAAQLAAATCRFLLIVAELDRREAWRQWGCASMGQWLSWKCGLGVVAGHQHVRVARALEHLPVTTGAFSEGRLSYSKVRALMRVATPGTEATLVEFALMATAAQVDQTVRVFERTRVDASTAAAQLAHQTMVVHHDDDGMVTMVVRLPRDGAETVLGAVKSGEAEVPADAAGDSAGSRRAHALVLVAEAFSAGRSQRPPTEMVVHLDADDLAEPSPVVERLLCDTSLRAVATDPAVGTATWPRRTRTIPRALRRLIAARDRGCRWPGCTHQRFLHVHHRVHFTRGGPTDAVNCFQLCTFHHRLVHEGGWRIAGDPAESSGLTFVSPRGHRMAEHEPAPAASPPLATDRRIDATTIATATGGRIDLDHAVTALHCLVSRPNRN